ncbi:uncharacterized protein BYT42DRAFT_553684 [Radiomyces spectabilis]|uniref:uncharacterized protein n=1 Tax=Radiomyces spectabilis TaxID=64574 RepID=UPI00221E598A|nr:uncharacterized protein BYT42DRAFT_553684 [Radiomyces spectabilis]KAI8394198.1 hypothetical protein BYT42DRAFT_553684 [Radiomyces spectabilis]
MRLKQISFLWLSVLICLLFATQAQAGFLDWLTGGKDEPSSTSSEPSPSSSSAEQSTQHSSVPVPTSSDDVPKPTSSSALPPKTSSSSPQLPPSTPASSIVASSSHPVSSRPPKESVHSSSAISSSAKPPSDSVQSSNSQSSSSSATPSAQPTDANSNDKGGNNNTGVIVGSVCAFVAVLGAGFGYAFFSKVRRNNRKKRLFTDQPSNDFPSQNPYASTVDYENRPSPAMTAAAIAAADSIHASKHQGWEHEQPPPPPMAQYGNYGHGYMSPQMPPATRDAYYSPPMPAQALSPTMNYPDAAISGAYYAAPQGYPYYDPSYVHYGDPYATHPNMLHTPSIPAVPADPIYSAPNAYDEPETASTQQRPQNPNHR